MKKRAIYHLAAVALLSAGIVASPARAVEIPVSRTQEMLSFAPVVKKVIPAVVNIYTRHVEKMQLSPLLSDPLFAPFFGRDFGHMPKERVVQSLGSGVIVAANGTIVTSYHVVKGSDAIIVVLNDKREFAGHVVKTDEKSDLAILQVDTKGQSLPVLSLRDSDTLEVGDLVLAVGNPFGVGQTVTSGIISALARAASDISDYQFFIQTDAAINPGNSGGALVDMDGRLIGINTAIYSHTGGYQGIGFAIPANMVSAVLSGQASPEGALIRPWLGIVVQPVSQEIADAAGMHDTAGVLVSEVAPESPAEQAGVRPGDILTQMAGGAIDSAQGLNFRIATTGIGHVTVLKIWRGGKELTLPVTLLATPKSRVEHVTLHGDHPLSGVTLAIMTPDTAQEGNLKPGTRAVMVASVEENSNTGLQPGDVLAVINGKEIRSLDDVKQALAAHPHRFSMTILRGGMVFTLTVAS